jgi:hypothetical protein
MQQESFLAGNLSDFRLRSPGKICGHCVELARKLSSIVPSDHKAGVAELADAPDSKSGARKGVEVQVLSPVLESS